MRTLCIFFFSFYFRNIVHVPLILWSYCDSKPCNCWYIHLRLLLQFFHLSLHMLFLIYFYTHVSYIIYAILYFCFTLRCLDEFCLKCFRNTSCQSLLAIKSLLAKFSRVCVRIDFIIFNKWIWVEWFMASLISHLFVVVMPWIAKGGDC